MATKPMWLEQANDEAVYNVYIYLIRKVMPLPGETLERLAVALRRAMERQKPYPWTPWDIRRLLILEGAVARSPLLAAARIGNVVRSKNGLNACTFEKPDGTVSVVFRGTASGEWIDNAHGVSGIPEENTYITYAAGGRELSRVTAVGDHAADGQVEALNWFHKTVARNHWSTDTKLRVSGHSKGGNKAQFITMHSPLVHACYSFDGQGFSPEAIAALRAELGTAFDERQRRIAAVCADNDYVHVLGKSLVLPAQQCYVEAVGGLHGIEAMLDGEGRFHPVTTRGALAAYVASVSDELMALGPQKRQPAVLGVMNLLQTFVGRTAPLGGERISVEDTVAGLALAMRTVLRKG